MGIKRRHQDWSPAGGIPKYLVIIAPEQTGLTPDMLEPVPADTEKQVDELWDLHDGRNHGTMVVGVYIYQEETSSYVRSGLWGILGDAGKTGSADEDADLI